MSRVYAPYSTEAEELKASDQAYEDGLAAKDALTLEYFHLGVQAKKQKDYSEADLLFGMAKEAGGKMPSRLEAELAATIELRKKERQKAERIAALLGPKPENSAWDASVEPVKRFLKNNLKDPDSLDVIEWSAVTAITFKEEPYWVVRCKYRAKNSFGGYVVEEKLFLIRQNTVVNYFDY